MIRRLVRDTRASVTALGAAGCLLGLGCLAFAVDLGSVYHESRRLQGAADAAALSAAANLTDPITAARAAVRANGWTDAVSVAVTPGRYSADPRLGPAARFSPVAGRADAAQVTLTTEARLFFGVAALGRGSIRIQRSATAARTNLAAFSIGSRLASLDGGILNALLGGLTGSRIDLTVMDYQALLGSEVDFLSFAEALRAEAKLSAGSFDQVLDAEIGVGDALSSVAAALRATGDGGAPAVIGTIASAAGETGRIRIGDLVDLGTLGGQDRIAGRPSIEVNAYDLVRAIAELGAGDRQVRLDFGNRIPGLLDSKVTLAIGARATNSPWLTVTDTGEPIIRTTQTRLLIDTTVAPAGLPGVASIRLPLIVELAEAEARLAAIRCDARGTNRTIEIDVRPAIGHASIADPGRGDLSDQTRPLNEQPARLVSLPLLSVTGRARMDLSDRGWRPVRFEEADIAARQWKTVSSNSLARGVAASLIGGMTLDVQVAGLGVGAGTLTRLIGEALQPAATPLDALINSLTGALGLHLGQADVRVNGVRCGQASLVA